jgi:hypothetical protein
MWHRRRIVLSRSEGTRTFPYRNILTWQLVLQSSRAGLYQSGLVRIPRKTSVLAAEGRMQSFAQRVLPIRAVLARGLRADGAVPRGAEERG